MGKILSEKVVALLRDKNTKKVLATIDKNGIPNVAFKGTITVNENGDLEVIELLETSQTNKNLTYSLWFRKYVAITIWGEGGEAYEIKGVPVKVYIDGPYYEEKYKEALARNSANDISGVWIIEPAEVRNQTYALRKKEQDEKYPILGHLDKDILGSAD